MFPANQGTQRRPSGAVGPVSQESQQPANNPYPQPYSAGTPQLSPLPLDNGALPHDDPFLVHGQPSSGLNALHQFNNHSNGTPYLGRPPFAYSAPVAHPYHRGYGDGPDQSPGLNAVVAWLVAEVQRLSRSVDLQHVTNNQLLASNQQLENSNQQLVESNQQLTMRVEAIELLQAESKNAPGKKKTSKNVSNEHILLKVSHRTVK